MADRRYEICEFWFVINMDKDGNYIQAWSDDKDMAEFYMAFHGTKRFKLRRVEDTLQNLNKMVNDYITSEIVLYNGVTREITGKKPWETTDVIIPTTKNEVDVISVERQNFMASTIGYGQLNDVFPILKKKYQEALKELYMWDVIKMVIHNKKSTIVQKIEFDDVRLMFKLLQDNFH